MNLKNLIYPFVLLLVISCGDQAVNTNPPVDNSSDPDPFAETFVDTNKDNNLDDTEEKKEALEVIVGNDTPTTTTPETEPESEQTNSSPGNIANYVYSIEKNGVTSKSNFQNINSQDEIILRLKLNVDQIDIGKKVDIFIAIVRTLDGVQTVFQKSGKDYVQWNGSRETLLPAYSGFTLAASQEDIIFEGKLNNVIGKVNIYFGYTINDKAFSGITYNDSKELAFYVY